MNEAIESAKKIKKQSAFRVGTDFVRLRRDGGRKYRAEFVRNSEVLESFTGSMKEALEKMLDYADAERAWKIESVRGK